MVRLRDTSTGVVVNVSEELAARLGRDYAPVEAKKTQPKRASKPKTQPAKAKKTDE